MAPLSAIAARGGSPTGCSPSATSAETAVRGSLTHPQVDAKSGWPTAESASQRCSDELLISPSVRKAPRPVPYVRDDEKFSSSNGAPMQLQARRSTVAASAVERRDASILAPVDGSERRRDKTPSNGWRSTAHTSTCGLVYWRTLQEIDSFSCSVPLRLPLNRDVTSLLVTLERRNEPRSSFRPVAHLSGN